MDRVTQRFPSDRDIIGVNFLAIVSYQSLRYGAWHSRLVQQCCRRPAQAMKRQLVDSPPSAVSYPAAAVAHGRWVRPQTGLYEEVAERARQNAGVTGSRENSK